jgi:hypothetical protein
MAPSRSVKDWLVHGLAAPLRLVARFQAWVAATVKKIPGWSEIEAAATQLTWPLRALAAWAVERVPLLRRYEWLFETERLSKYPPVMLAATLLFMAYRGLSTTRLGHIGTDSLIYPSLAIVSGFNPFLGGVSALTFGAGDIVQKLLINDIYGTPQDWVGHYFNLDYWGSIIGYVFSYSAPLLMGLLPGLASRVARQAVRVSLRKIFYRQAAAAADGARPPGDDDDPAYRLFARRRADGATEWIRSTAPPSADWIAQGDPVSRAEADAFLEGIRSGELQVNAAFPDATEAFREEDIA